MRDFFTGFVFCLILLPSYLSAAVEPEPPVLNNSMPVYSGEGLKRIEFPVGGIGTGNIVIDGRGSIRHLEIFDKPHRDELPPEMTFFSLWLKQGEKTASKILERGLFADQPNPFGVPRQQLAGLPRFEKCEFRGEFPFARVTLQDPDIPLNIMLETFNPLIPGDARASGYPVAIFNWHLENTTDQSMTGAIAFNMANPVQAPNDAGAAVLGENVNAVLIQPPFEGIAMSSKRAGLGSSHQAELAMGTTEKDMTLLTRWYRGDWWDDAQLFWKDFSDDGQLKEMTESDPSPMGKTDVATVLVRFSLKPGQKKVVPFYLFWRVPYRMIDQSYALGQKEAVGKKVKTFYAKEFETLPDILKKYFKKEKELVQQTRAFHQALYQTTLPAEVLGALASGLATLKTPIFMRTDKGKIHSFEGLGNDFGCCAGNCTHVWNYAQTMAFIFPSLERGMREVHYEHDTFKNGYQAHRTVFPLGKYWYDGPPAADGQLGNVMRVYRDWKLYGKSKWLKDLWPHVVQSLDFAWQGVGDVNEKQAWQKKNLPVPWDADKDGVIEGVQHNTYDIDFYGPNMMIGSLYLGALKAASQMALAVGDLIKAEEYRVLYQSGRQKYEQLCWNGQYYEQQVQVAPGLTLPEKLKSPPDAEGRILPKYQFGQGCLSDQLLGQYLAHVSGLGYILDAERVDRAMYAIYRFNFEEKLKNLENVQRVYGMNDEGGLITCTWPKGNRPDLPFVYSDEVWTGIEYQAASSMIYSGLIEEGLNVVKAVRHRYAGFNRNPYGDIESGRHYVRGMSSWALLLALSGFQYDASDEVMAFQPRISHYDFQTFWSCGKGWGTFKLQEQELALSVIRGKIHLETLYVTGPQQLNRIVRAEKNGSPVKVELLGNSGEYRFLFKGKLKLKSGDTFHVVFE